MVVAGFAASSPRVSARLCPRGGVFALPQNTFLWPYCSALSVCGFPKCQCVWGDVLLIRDGSDATTFKKGVNPLHFLHFGATQDNICTSRKAFVAARDQGIISMQAFDFDRKLINDYSEFSRSFIKVRAGDLTPILSERLSDQSTRLLRRDVAGGIKLTEDHQAYLSYHRKHVFSR